MNSGEQNPHWSIDIDVVEQRDNDTMVNAQVVMVGDGEQPALYRDDVAWQTLKSDLIRKQMGFQLTPPDWSDTDMKTADRTLARNEPIKGRLDASVPPKELESIGFKRRRWRIP